MGTSSADGSDKQLFVTMSSTTQKRFPGPQLTLIWQRHSHQKTPVFFVQIHLSITLSVEISGKTEQNKTKKEKMINLYFLSFQQKGKPEEFSIGLTISLGLCPAQNKMFHFMPGLIETCLKCRYIFKLFISKSLFTEAHIRTGQCSVL